MSRSIAVLGPGGVGGFIAAALARAAEDVCVIGRPDTVEVIARDGIAVRSVLLGDFTARPRAAVVLREAVEVLFVATKATALREALARVEEPPGLVVPLLNGLDHVTLLRERFGPERVAVGTIRIEADRPSPGRIVQTSPSVRVDLASDDPALHPAIERLASRMRSAEIPAQIGAGEAETLWSKLVRLNALACTTSAADRTIGFIRSDPGWRGVLEDCLDETAAVANGEGARIAGDDAMAELDDAHPELGSSMQRDIAAGREPELDAIPGAVIRAGARHGLPCPTIERLVGIIAERAGMGLRADEIAPPVRRVE